jgi:hypothetical protein
MYYYYYYRRATPKPEISQRSTDGRDIVATGQDRAKGYRDVDIHVILPQKEQTIKGVAFGERGCEAGDCGIDIATIEG